MRKVLTFLAASLAVACSGPIKAQTAPDMFKDLDRNHWAYEAVESLRSKGIVVGYPDGYFRGKRTLTRYEFAVALDRALKKLNVTGQVGPQGDKGDVGPQGPAGQQGPPGVTPEELATLRRLLQEFRDELAALGNNMRAIQARVDALTRDVASIHEELNRMPKIHGGAFVGFRSDVDHGNYVDRNGIVNPLRNNQAVVHLFDLGVAANITGGATLAADVQFDNYKNYLGGSFGRVVPTGFTAPSRGGATLSSSVPADTRVDRLEIATPFGGLGRGSQLAIGRLHERLGHLTLWKPDVDTYFDNPFIDDGAFRMDGARLTTNFGSVSFEAFGGQLASVQGTDGFGPVNSPLIGNISPAVFFGNSKPIGQVNVYNGNGTLAGNGEGLGTNILKQLVGVSAGIGLHQFQGGHLRLTAMDTSTTALNGFYSGVFVLGTDADLQLANKLSFSYDYGRTTPHVSRTRTIADQQNNAFNVNFGYKTGGLSASAGYRYIDPLFYAPGYWGRIGNWLNPTNVQGPTLRADYTLMNNLGISLGGDYFTPVRNRALSGGLGNNDEIYRALAGLHWNLSRGFQVTTDWEGVFWTFQGPHSGIPGQNGLNRFHPTEHYVTIGTGYHLTDATLLQLAYQIKAFDGHNILTEGPVGTKDSAGMVTAQASVRF